MQNANKQTIFHLETMKLPIIASLSFVSGRDKIEVCCNNQDLVTDNPYIRTRLLIVITSCVFMCKQNWFSAICALYIAPQGRCKMQNDGKNAQILLEMKDI